MWYLHTMDDCSAIKRMESCHLQNMDGPRDDHTKWSKSDRERQVAYGIAYMRNLKWYKWTYVQNRSRPTDIGCIFYYFFILFYCLLFYFIVFYFRATPTAYGGSQARGLIGAYTTATAMPDLSRVCDLHHSSWQPQILSPLREGREWTCLLKEASQIRFCWATVGTPLGCMFQIPCLSTWAASSFISYLTTLLFKSSLKMCLFQKVPRN